MSKLYGSMDADRSKTLATRQASGRISAHLRGWDEGVKVSVWVRSDGKVAVEVSRSTGSNETGPDVVVCSWVEGAPVLLEPVFAS